MKRLLWIALAIVGCDDGGGPPEPDAGFDEAAAAIEASAYLEAEQDLLERYCTAILACCDATQRQALAFGIFWALQSDSATLEECVEAISWSRGDVEEWGERISAGIATFDRDAHAACAEQVAATQECAAPAFDYVLECPVFARGDGEEGARCGGPNNDDTQVCGPGLWCDNFTCARSRGPGEDCVEPGEGFELLGPPDPGTERDEACGHGLTCQRGRGCAPLPAVGEGCQLFCATGGVCVRPDDEDFGVCEAVDLACAGE